MMLSGGDAGDGDGSPTKPSSSSSAQKVPHHSGNDREGKDKQIMRAAVTVLTPAELLAFKVLLSPSKSEAQEFSGDYSAESDGSPLSAIVIGNNEDLLSQLFLYLPAKCLIRFQCVSKLWLSLISSTHFRCLHSRGNPTSSPSSSSATSAGVILFRRIYKTPELNSFPLREQEVNATGLIQFRLSNFAKAHGEILHLHSCNGLFCVDFHWNYEIRRLYVYNPTIDQSRLIPWPDIKEKYHKILSLNIAFDPRKSDHYKIVCIWVKLIKLELQSDQEEGEEEFQEEEDQYQFSVYSSGSGTWKDCVHVEVYLPPYYFKNGGVFWNGKLYWTNRKRALQYFDMELEYIRHIFAYGRDSWNGDVMYLGESGGNLHLIEIPEPQTNFLDVLELKKDLEVESQHFQWNLKYRVDLTLLTTLYPLMIDEELDLSYMDRFSFGILHFVEDEMKEEAKVVISLPGKIISYEINNVVVKELVEVKPDVLRFLWKKLSRYTWKEAYQHFETLACVN